MTTLAERIAIIVDAQTGGAVRDFEAATAASGKFTKSAEEQRIQIGKLSLTHEQLATGLKVGVTTAAVTAAYALGRLAKESVQAAEDEFRSQQKVQSAFGSSAKSVLDFSAGAAKSLGLSATSANEAASSYGLFFRNLGITQKNSAAMSQQLVTLAVNMAALHHVDPTAMFTALQSGIAGNARGLKIYGIDLSSAALGQEAVRLGLEKTIVHTLPLAIKAQAAYSLIVKQTTDATGAFAAQSHTLYGEQQQLSAQTENAKAQLGQGLLPVELQLIKVGNDLIPVVDAFAKILGNKAVEATLAAAAGLYAVNKAMKISKDIADSGIIRLLAQIALGHTQIAEATAAEGDAAALAAPKVAALAESEKLSGGLGLGGKLGRAGLGVGAGLLLSQTVHSAGGGNPGVTVGGDVAGGALAGAAVGSVVPGVGTALGAGVGAGVGLVGGIFQAHSDESTKAKAASAALAAELKKEAAASSQAVAALDLHALSLKKDASAADKTTGSLGKYLNVLSDQAGKAIAATQSSDAFISSLQSMEQTAHDSGRALTGESAAAVGNREAFAAAAQAVRDHVASLKDEGKSADYVNAYLVQMASALQKTADQTYGNSKQVDQLLQQWGLLPKELASQTGAYAEAGEATGAALANGFLDALSKAQAQASAAGYGPKSWIGSIISGQASSVKHVQTVAKSIPKISIPAISVPPLDLSNLTSPSSSSKSSKTSKAAKKVGETLGQKIVAAIGQTIFQGALGFERQLTQSLEDYASATEGINQVNQGTASFIGTERAKRNDLTRFAHLYGRLAKLGLNHVLLNQFLQAGPSAIDAMEELLRNPKEIREANKTEQQIERISGRLSTKATQELYGKGLQRAVDKLPDKVAEGVAKALRENGLHVTVNEKGHAKAAVHRRRSG